MGGGMVRADGRAVGAGVGAVQEALSASSAVPTKPNTPNLFSLSSNSASISGSSSSSPSPSRHVAATSPASATLNSSSCSSCLCDWDYGGKQERTNGSDNKFVFGPVPSKDEVQDAVSALQKVLIPASYSELVDAASVSSSGLTNKVSADGSKLDWITPTEHVYNPRTSQSRGGQRVYDAFNLLQTEPSVQRMVVSLSTDKAVWNAVLNNNAVRELRDSFYRAENNRGGSSGESPDPAMSILRWILDNTKVKVTELIEKITKLLSEAFQHAERGKATTAAVDILEDALRSSLLLSVVILLIVIVTRVHRNW